MVGTYEEKLAKLKLQENWWAFTDGERVFLDGMAQGMKPLDAVKRAYPDTRAGRPLVVLTKGMLSRVGIQKSLTSIGIDVSMPTLSKSDAVKVLTKDFWKATDPEIRMKLAAMIAKFEGWDKEVETSSEEVSLDKLVAAVEKKRRANL